MNKLFKIDKLLHLLVGFMLASLVTILTKEWYLVLLIPTLIGIGKELRDKWMRKGTPEWWDAVATVVGAVAWIVVWWLINL